MKFGKCECTTAKDAGRAQGELVESGPADVLHRKRWSRNVVRIVCCEERPEVDGLLRLSPHVEEISLDGREVTFEYTGEPQEFYRVIKLLTDNHVPILEVGHESRDLENLFMELTRGEVQ